MFRSGVSPKKCFVKQNLLFPKTNKQKTAQTILHPITSRDKRMLTAHFSIFLYSPQLSLDRCAQGSMKLEESQVCSIKINSLGFIMNFITNKHSRKRITSQPSTITNSHARSCRICQNSVENGLNKTSYCF